MRRAESRSNGPRFAAQLSDVELVAAVREIAVEIDPDTPSAVTRAQWDVAVRSGRWPGVPMAAGLRKRFGAMGWQELLHLALDPDRDLIKTVEARTRRPPTAPPDPDEIEIALRIADSYQDPDDPSFGRPDAYERIRTQLTSRAQRRWRHGHHADTLLPDRYEIENACAAPGEAGWDRARQDSGLRPRVKGSGARRGNDPVDLAMRMGRELGFLPASMRHLRAYAKAKRESLAAYPAGISGVNAEANRRRGNDGLPPLAAAPAGCRDVGETVPDRSNATNPRRGDWATREQIVAGLARAYAEIGPGATLTQKLHRHLAMTHPGEIPYPSAVQKFVDDHPELNITAADLREAGRAQARSRLG